MAEKGIVRPTGAAAHHIVAFDDPRALAAQEVLEQYDVGINNAENGVYLPDSVDSPAPGVYHRGVHTNLYYSEVNEMLSQAKSREEVINILNKIRRMLLDDTFDY